MENVKETINKLCKTANKTAVEHGWWENELQQIEEKDRASSNVQPVKKKLVIKFWRAEKALAMQILEQEGLPEKKMYGLVNIERCPNLCIDAVELRGGLDHCDFNVVNKHFSENRKRDEYLDKITKAITDELFAGRGDLKVGEMCEVKISDDHEWMTRKLLAILPEEQSYGYICNHSRLKDAFTMCKYARPLCKRIEPKVEECGEIITYTWEEK